MKGQIKDEIKKARSARLLTLNDEHSRLFRQQFSGVTTQVLLEDYKHGYWEGLTDNYLRVQFEGREEWRGELVAVRVLSVGEDGTVSGVQAFRLSGVQEELSESLNA